VDQTLIFNQGYGLLNLVEGVTAMTTIAWQSDDIIIAGDEGGELYWYDVKAIEQDQKPRLVKTTAKYLPQDYTYSEQSNHSNNSQSLFFVKSQFDPKNCLDPQPPPSTRFSNP